MIRAARPEARDLHLRPAATARNVCRRACVSTGMRRFARPFLAATFVALASSSGCLYSPLASYAPCEGRMARQIGQLPADRVTHAMRDSAKAEARNCTIENAMAAARLNEQVRQTQQQQVDDALGLEQVNRRLLNTPTPPATQP